MKMGDFEPTYIEYVYKAENRVFANMVPTDYFIGIGAVISAWANFEMTFVNFLDMLRWPPQVQKLCKITKRTPLARRAEALPEAAVIALPDAPVLQKMIGEIATEALDLGLKRNNVTHGQFFPFKGMLL